jgi:N-acyl-D-aspartate/D-glutamate deacylase
VAVSQGDIVAMGSLPATARHSYPTGVAHVAVNGVLVVENGAFTGRTPGKVIRSFAD